MSTTLVVIAAVVVVVLVAAVLRRRRDTAAELTSAPVEVDGVLGDFVDAMYRSASEADALYLDALERLREEPERAGRQIEAAYNSLSSDQMRARESLLFAAAALAHTSLLPLLSEVAQRPHSGTARHDGGRAAEESMLRMIAVDGIEAIARTGDTQAAEALLSLATSADRAVQAAAVVALKYAEIHRDQYVQARGVLPVERLYLLDVVRASVHDVPQIADPRRHLRSEPTTVDARPDPASGERRGAVGPASRARVPKAGGGG